MANAGTLPPDIVAVLRDQPRRMDRRAGAAFVTHYFFPVSPRTLEEWPIPTKLVNRKATIATADLAAFAQAKLDAAPEIMGGRKLIS